MEDDTQSNDYKERDADVVDISEERNIQMVLLVGSWSVKVDSGWDTHCPATGACNCLVLDVS